MMRALLIVAIAVAYTAYHFLGVGGHGAVTHYDLSQPAQLPTIQQQALAGGEQIIRQAFERQSRHLQVEATGSVIKVLPDDTKPPQHQRFLLKLENGITLLVAHNIDLAPRVPGLKVGDALEFSGEYEWNKKGGVVHWTHHDPDGRHVAGWLRHNGNTYQ